MGPTAQPMDPPIIGERASDFGAVATMRPPPGAVSSHSELGAAAGPGARAATGRGSRNYPVLGSR